MQVNVNSIFLTANGEPNGFGIGTWCVFVRLQGCAIGCQWCDTKYTWPDNPKLGTTLGPTSIEDVRVIVDRVGSVEDGEPPNIIMITGGEPLAQKDTPMLVRYLVNHGYDVIVETSGRMPLFKTGDIRRFVSFVVDYKLGDSRAVGEHVVDLSALVRRDVIKFVISSRADYEEARAVVVPLDTHAPIYFMPCDGKLTSATLYHWMKTDEDYRVRHKARLGVQEHKMWFPDNPREEESAVE